MDSIFTDRAFATKNGKFGRRVLSGLSVIRGLLRRILILLTARGDLLIVHREAFPFFTPVSEAFIARQFAYSVVDVDDAIYEASTHRKDWRRFFRNPHRALRFGSIFDLVTCGGREVALKYKSNGGTVKEVPTCPEPERAQITRHPERIVAWIGSMSTLGNLAEVLPQVLRACVETGSRLMVLGGANVAELPRHPNLVAQTWSKRREVDLLSRARVGIMPLSESDWDAGKSAYKAILYLVSGVPALVSAVGENGRLVDRYPRSTFAITDWYSDLKNCLLHLSRIDADELEAIRSTYDSARVYGDLRDHLVRALAA